MLSTRSLAISTILLETVVVVIAVFLGSNAGNIIIHFKEGGLITWVSFFQLLAISGLSWRIFIMEPTRDIFALRSSPTLWALIAVGFLFLAGDEVMQIHEKLDRFTHKVFHIQETGLTDRLDDIIVALYGFIGLGALYYYREEVRKYFIISPFFLSGCAFFLLMVTVDILTNREDIILFIIPNWSGTKKLILWLEVVEESFKLFAEGFFLVGFYRVLRRVGERSAT